jgi:hypothetical protein
MAAARFVDSLAAPNGAACTATPQADQDRGGEEWQFRLHASCPCPPSGRARSRDRRAAGVADLRPAAWWRNLAVCRSSQPPSLTRLTDMADTPDSHRAAARALASRAFKAYGVAAMLIAISARTVARALELPSWVPRAVVLGAFASLPAVFAGLWLWARHSRRHLPPQER